MKNLILFFDFTTGRPRRRYALALEFKLADLWVGAFWKHSNSTGGTQFQLWVCLLPCLPFHFTYIAERKGAWRG